MKRPNRFKCLSEIVTAAVTQAAEDDISRLGAALAFYAMLSLVPMLVLLLASASFFYGHDVARQQIHELIFRFAGLQEADTVQNILDSASQYASMSTGEAVFSFVILLYGATNVFNQLQGAMNLIWRVPPHTSGAFVGYIKENLFSLLIVSTIGLLLIASVFLDAILSIVIHYALGVFPVLVKLAQVGNAVFCCLMMAGIFSVAFKFIPGRKIEWKDVWPGAALTAIFSTLGQVAIGIYLGHSSVTAGYGAGGSLVALLIGLYYLAQIFFFGVILTHIYAEKYGSLSKAKD